jgi:ribose 5-phosphate isomerase B
MKQEDFEQLIQIITAEVLKVITTKDLQEGKTNCGCASSRGSQGEGYQGKTKNGEWFDGRVLTMADIDRVAAQEISRILLRPGTVVTPLAHDVAREKNIALTRSALPAETKRCAPVQAGQTVVVVSAREHRSQEQAVVCAAEAKGYSTRLEPPTADRGDAILKAAIRCAGLIAKKEFCRLVVLAENVYPLALQLNRIEGVRSAVCWDAQTASQSEKVSKANVLILNNRLLGVPMLRRIIEAWMEESG